jgi:phospholipid N-methyltransferase
MTAHDETTALFPRRRSLRSLSLLRPLTEAGTFFREFLREPAMVGSIIPTAGGVVDAALASVDWGNCKLFVEYGPGMGNFTRAVLERLRDDAKLIAIDTNPHFIEHLRRDLRDPRLVCVHGSAADVQTIVGRHGYSQADYVLSGLPFSTLPQGVGEHIAASTHAVLRPGGAFLIYQYSRYVRRHLDSRFDQVDQRLNWLNIPPCYVFAAWKAEEQAAASDVTAGN